jgi:hypothetical protein
LILQGLNQPLLFSLRTLRRDESITISRYCMGQHVNTDPGYQHAKGEQRDEPGQS